MWIMNSSWPESEKLSLKIEVGLVSCWMSQQPLPKADVYAV